jgi:very-short-patch-repair endonuclease
MSREQINNRKELESKRKRLRNNSTPAEIFLWTLLKNKELGRKFRRQHSVGNYILDFYCPSEKLAIELDGAGHFEPRRMEYDKVRTAYLNSLGIKVVRFENEQVFQSPGGVLAEIRKQFDHQRSAVDELVAPEKEEPNN